MCFFLLACLLFSLFSVFGPTGKLVDHKTSRHPFLSVDNLRETEEPEDEDSSISVSELDHELLFQETIRSCIPGRENKGQTCRTFIPEPIDADKKVQRIAVLAPPGDISDSLLKRVEDIQSQHNRRHTKVDVDMSVFETSHVPPYGYGKTHGLTRVLRLVPQPLILEVIDALVAVLERESHDDLTHHDLRVGLRQILRFHCRLSHLSAHTALSSVTYSDLLFEPAEVLEELHEFLVPNDRPEKGHPDDDALHPHADDDETGMFEDQDKKSTAILTRIQKEEKVDVMRTLDNVLLEELRQTKNMTTWPCLSFWSAGDLPDTSKLSPITKRLAQALSPDCKDPYAKCGVHRDRCEAAGDPVCNK